MNKTIDKFREDNVGELQKNMDRLVAIRDQPHDLMTTCPECKHRHEVNLSSAARDKGRIEAVKGIARHLGALQPERAGALPQDPGSSLDKKLSKEEEAKLDEFLEGKGGEDSKMVS